jgi:hypothetical protein
VLHKRLEERGAELDALRSRLDRIQRELAALDDARVEADWLERTLGEFDAVWDALTPENHARLIAAGVVADRAELANVLGFMRARVTQLLDLTLLASRTPTGCRASLRHRQGPGTIARMSRLRVGILLAVVVSAPGLAGCKRRSAPPSVVVASCDSREVKATLPDGTRFKQGECLDYTTTDPALLSLFRTDCAHQGAVWRDGAPCDRTLSIGGCRMDSFVGWSWPSPLTKTPDDVRASCKTAHGTFVASTP